VKAGTLNESQDAAADLTNDQADDGFARQLAAAGWARLAEFIGELRREVAETGDPVKRAHLEELEAATNMTPARRVMGRVRMEPDLDPRYPPADVYAQAVALIVAVPPSAGYGVGGHTEAARIREWRHTLDHHEWHGKPTFLTASIEHCRRLSGWLSGQSGREEDAATFRQLCIDLDRLEHRGDDQESGESARGDLTGEELALVVALEKLMELGQIKLDSFISDYARPHDVKRTTFMDFKAGKIARLVGTEKRAACASAIREALQKEGFTT
jgi:hypothetical protein